MIFNTQKRSRAFKIGEHHYDIGNNLYEAMLDKEMVYSAVKESRRSEKY